jgi:chemotaxis protein methyltransferase CheR
VIKLLPDDQKELSRYIHSISAVALDNSKGYLIEGRLSGLAEEIGCRTFGELIVRAKSDPAGTIRGRLIDAITTGETLFFRDTGPFDLLRYKILPEMIDRRSRPGGARPIRIWSAACSTGQEIYSIAIVLKEMLGDPERHGVRLLGTDISNEAVARASRAVYNQIEISRGLGDAIRSKYFQPAPGGWKVRDDIRGMAHFRTLNLMQDFSALGKFDIIFCRNVAIYFTERDRASLFTRIGRMLDRDGCLIIGAMESLTAICPQFEAKRHVRSVYYTVKSA